MARAIIPATQAQADEWRRTGTIAQCCGACDQGRKPCASPDACHRAEQDSRYSTPAEDAGFLAAITIACIALIVIVSVVYTHRETLLGWLR